MAEHLIFPKAMGAGPADDHVKVDTSLPLFDHWWYGDTRCENREHSAWDRRVQHWTSPPLCHGEVRRHDRRHDKWTRHSWGWFELASPGVGGRGARVDFRGAGSTRPSTSAGRSGREERRASWCGLRLRPVVFNPKPTQRRIPIHIGGDSGRALRRVVQHGDGWIAMLQTVESFATATKWLQRACEGDGRSYRAWKERRWFDIPTQRK